MKCQTIPLAQRLMPTAHEVQPGDCVSSIAYEQGFFWQTIWDHADNADLKRLRKDPNILKAGDVVQLPDLTLKAQSAATEKRHRFRLKGVPVFLRLRILRPPPPPKSSPAPTPGPDSREGKDCLTEDPEPIPPTPDEPRANVPYSLEIDGRLIQDQTDADGIIHCSIPPNARTGRLTVEPGTPQELVVPLLLAHLAPLSELSGIKQRLANLGLGCGDLTDDPTPELAAALSAFQEQQGLELTGELNAATRDALLKVHGS